MEVKTMKTKTIFVVAVLLALCRPTLAEWTEPVPVTEVNTEYADWTPFLSFDGLTLYFARVRTDTFYYGRIFEATRQQPFGPFTSVNEVLKSSYQHVFAPWVSPDNLRMYYFAQKDSPSLWQLKFSERASVNDPWPQGTNISELNQLGKVYKPALTADELIIVFNSYDIAGGQGGYDIWMATRPDRYSPFGAVRNLAEINTASNDGDPFISPDGLMLYFQSNRNGFGQLFRATRQSLSEPLGNVEHLSIFDTPGGHSGHPCISSDGSTLYFIRQIGDDKSTGDIYVSYWIVDPYDVAVTGIEDAIAEKLEALEKVNAAIEKEWAACDTLEELLEIGDYGDLSKGDIVTAMQQIQSSIQYQELSKKTLQKSIEKLLYSLSALGYGPQPPGSNWPPYVTITKPRDGTTFNPDQTIEIEVNAWDLDGSVVTVEFFADGSKIGEDNEGTDGWTMSWSEHPVGSYSLTAQATDDDGAATTSPAVEIMVVILPPPPPIPPPPVPPPPRP
jgi:hypothetical protein